MLHYYLEKGIMPEQIQALPPINQMFYMASMMLAMEERKKMIQEINQQGR